MSFGIIGNLASFSTSATPMSFDLIRKEIEGGLKNEQKRIESARIAKDYYEGNFEPYMTDYGRILGIRDNAPNRRPITYARAIVKAKTRRLYMSDPKRTITDHPEATEYLQSLYSKGRVKAKLKAAIRYAAIGGAAAIQVEVNQPTNQAEVEATLAMLRPAVNFRVWSADQFVVWCPPGSPLTPYAVGTIDVYDAQKRLRLWTPETFAVFTTRKWDGTGDTRGTRDFTLQSTEDNFLGIVPFAFVWHEEPVEEFWGWSLGDILVNVNEGANARLSKIADDVMFDKPIKYSRGVQEGWKPPDRPQSGDVHSLPGIGDATIGVTGDGPSIETVAVDLSYVEHDRNELEAHLELQGEMHGVPKEQWRLSGRSAPSGVAIISEQLPIIEECEERQSELESSEKDLAAVTLLTVSNWLGGNPVIDAALANFDLAIQWAPLTKNRPGPDFDAHAEFELRNGLASEVQVWMEQHGATREEAYQHFEEAAEDIKFTRALMPEEQQQPVDAGQQQQEQQQGGDQNASQ